MELSDAISVDRFLEFTDIEKNELCSTLLELSVAVHDIPRKALRKTLDITLAALKYKSEQIREFQERSSDKTIITETEVQNERVLKENEQLKLMLEQLEDESAAHKEKIKELNDEIFQLQKRLEQATNASEISDKDSSDPLSELDKQEELLRNINSKNKHIRRLTHDIATLQGQNVEQSKILVQYEIELQQLKVQISELNVNHNKLESERKELMQNVNTLKIEIARLESNVTYLEEEREKSQNEIKKLVRKYEEKIKKLAKQLEHKDLELQRNKKSTTTKTTTTTNTNAKVNASESTENSSKEYNDLLCAIETRDKQIEELELKIKSMAKEMLNYTKLMNKLSTEKYDESNTNKKSNSCCKNLEDLLNAANERSCELTEMLATCEDDSRLQSKRVQHLQGALEAYQLGDDGVAKVLRKCTALERKLISRDKSIRSLVQEVNSLHEVGQENQELRRRLNIDDDVSVTSKNSHAKERNKQKIIDKLSLKLRASEEMRLQLKLTITDLRKEIIELRKLTNQPELVLENNSARSYHKQPPSEVGEIDDTSTLDTEDEINLGKETTPPKYLLKIQQQEQQNLQSDLLECQHKYQEILQENETLRIGMHEILQKLHSYSESSNFISIDSEMLLRLLNTLQRSVELENSRTQKVYKSREILEHEELFLNLSTDMDKTVDKTETEDISMFTPQQLRDHESTEESIRLITTPELVMFNSSTRPTTPCPELDLPEIEPLNININNTNIDATVPQTNTNNTPIPKPTPTPTLTPKTAAVDQEDCFNYRQLYELLKVQISNSESDTKKYCAQLVEDIAAMDTELKKQKSTYAFLQCELDKELSLKKDREVKHIKLVATLKQQINEKHAEFSQLDAAFQLYKKQFYHAEHDVNELQRNKERAEAQMAKIVNQVLSGEIADNMRIKELCISNYGIIEEDFHVNYITAKEYEDEKANYTKTVEKHEQLRRQLSQLEGLLQIAQDQIKSQQKLINELTDNHIDLRHLVADLQSTNEDKFLLAKMQRDLDAVKLEITNTKDDRVELVEKCATLEIELQTYKELIDTKDKELQLDQQNNAIKLKFLGKSLLILKEKYAKFTPLIFLTNFVYAYTKFIKEIPMNTNASETSVMQHVKDIVESHLAKKGFQRNDDDSSSNLIKCIRLKTQRQLLEENLMSLNQKCQNLELELNELKIRHVTENEHWKTIEALFSANMPNNNTELKKVYSDMGVNTINDSIVTPTNAQNDQATQTMEKEDERENIIQNELMTKIKEIRRLEAVTQTAPIIVESQAVQTLTPVEFEKRDYNMQLQCAMDTITDKDNQLATLEREIKLIRQRAADLEKMLFSSETENEKLHMKIKNFEEPHQVKNNHADIIEKTIISFHKLLSEKDLSIVKYEELLKNQQEQIQSNSEKLEADIESLKNTITNLNFNIKTKDIEILELKNKIKLAVKLHENPKNLLTMNSKATGNEEEQLINVEPNFHELTDDHIEEMFDQERELPKTNKSIYKTNGDDVEIIEKQENELKEIPSLLKLIKELKDKIIYFEQTLHVKDEELNLLREKLHYYQEREKQEDHINRPEIEQLRIVLEEKDKHINDLMNTLRSFHDDQERYLNDATNNSADQLAKLATDLKRCEATNHIYQTQLEAMRRQMNSLTQREKQTRELNTTLRNELIKRPVVSIKTELNARVKNENLQKRIQQLENELEECRTQIQRQQARIDTKRASSANEVSLWEKQKRWQQNAEKFKIKLEETEAALEKTRTLLQSARNTIARLEKDKHVLEAKLNKGNGNMLVNMKCCRTASCVNSQQHGSAKYTPSESPETYTSDTSSPAHGSPAPATAKAGSSNTNDEQIDDGGVLLIEALKARIELQQRKILAMELEGKGKNVLNVEIERLLERCSRLEAQNIRIEANNLQLQLDNDLMRQGDSSERQQKRIKHLEDYIIALKEEIAALETRRDVCNCGGQQDKQASQHHADNNKNSAEQTILSLRSIVEKLRMENKFLKENRPTSNERQHQQQQQQPTAAHATAEINRLQKRLNEAMEKIAQLTKELAEKAKCSMCSAHSKAAAHTNEELNYIKEQLAKKSELLQKAKVLLTRAAAKEKVLKDQVTLWKRKCSELQNVPVIDEISE